MIAYHAELGTLARSTNAGLFLSQLIYWLGKGDDPDRYNYKTAAGWTEETGLSSKAQRTARAKWVALGVLRERARGGWDRTLEYAIDWGVLAELAGRCFRPQGQKQSAQRANAFAPTGTLHLSPQVPSICPKGSNLYTKIPSKTPQDSMGSRQGIFQATGTEDLVSREEEDDWGIPY